MVVREPMVNVRLGIWFHQIIRYFFTHLTVYIYVPSLSEDLCHLLRFPRKQNLKDKQNSAQIRQKVKAHGSLGV